MTRNYEVCANNANTNMHGCLAHERSPVKLTSQSYRRAQQRLVTHRLVI